MDSKAVVEGRAVWHSMSLQESCVDDGSVVRLMNVAAIKCVWKERSSSLNASRDLHIGGLGYDAWKCQKKGLFKILRNLLANGLILFDVALTLLHCPRLDLAQYLPLEW